MHTLLAAQRQALAQQQAACSLRPLLHAHTLAALERERALCEAAPSLAAYQAASGQGFELMRACWLDRCAHALRLAASLGDAAAAQGAWVAYRQAMLPAAHAAWLAALVRGATLAQPWRQRAAEAAHGLDLAVRQQLQWQTGAMPAEELMAAAQAGWQAFVRADPAASSAALQGRWDDVPQARMLPWDAQALQRLTLWLGPLGAPEAVAGAGAPELRDALAQQQQQQARWMRALAHAAPAPGPVVDEAAGLQAALQPYVTMAEAAGSLAAVARRVLDLGASSGPELAARMWQARLPAALANAAVEEGLRAIEDRQVVWPTPLLQGHVTRLRNALAQAVTDTEVEALAAHAQACLEVEAAWQAQLMGVALAPLRAALMAVLTGQADGPPPQQAVLAAHSMLGLGPRSLLALTPVRAVLQGCLLPACRSEDGPGSLLGECGAELLTPLRAWTAVRGSAPTWADIVALPDQAGLPEPPAQATQLRLWGRTAGLSDWEALIAHPPRPALQGWTGPAA